jgi:hypothetical protein
MRASPDTLELESKPELHSNQDIQRKRPHDSTNAAVDEYIYLAGRPNLKQFVRFVRNHAVSRPDKGSLAEEWQAAQNHIHTLETEEAGLADNPLIRKLGPEYEPLLIEFLKDPLVRRGFNTVPTEVAIVELDRMVVYQKHIDRTFAGQLKNKLGPAPSEEEIFRTCLPYDHPSPPVKWSRNRSNSFVFMSPSNDLRFLGTMPLESNHITGYPPPGSLVGVVGIAVGFGSNFLNAVYAEKRLILNNGSHRAYTLRELGCTHVPCIVQHVSSRDQLDLVGSAQIRRNPDHYLKHPRPSMLKDYFDPKLHKRFQVQRRLRQITVKFEVDEAYVPAL